MVNKRGSRNWLRLLSLSLIPEFPWQERSGTEIEGRVWRMGVGGPLKWWESLGGRTEGERKMIKVSG